MSGNVMVSLQDLALVLYLPEPTVTNDGRCAACGQPAGSHYCEPRQSANWRLRQLVSAQLNQERQRP